MLVFKDIRLDEITLGEEIDRKEKSSKEGPSEISPALDLASAAGRGYPHHGGMGPLGFVPDD